MADSYTHRRQTNAHQRNKHVRTYSFLKDWMQFFSNTHFYTSRRLSCRVHEGHNSPWVTCVREFKAVSFIEKGTFKFTSTYIHQQAMFPQPVTQVCLDMSTVTSKSLQQWALYRSLAPSDLLQTVSCSVYLSMLSSQTAVPAESVLQIAATAGARNELWIRTVWMTGSDVVHRTQHRMQQGSYRGPRVTMQNLGKHEQFW